MAKNNYLPGLLLAAALFFCGSAVSNHLGKHSQQPGTRYPERLVQQADTLTRVKTLYTLQVGIREKGLNRGPEVEKYLRYVGLSKGQPWCAAFVCWVFGKAGVPNPRSGWSPALFPHRKVIWNRDKDVHLNRTPRAGDVFGIYFPQKNRIAHVGFVDLWQKNWVITVEGNTNTAGSVDGDGVYKKRRPQRSIYQVARYIHSSF